MDIFVGSLPFKLKESELKELFETHGEVASAKIIIDKITRQNKGFGFVEMPNDEEALKAISALNNQEVQGRRIVVNKSEKKESTEPRPFRGTNSNRIDPPKESSFTRESPREAPSSWEGDKAKERPREWTNNKSKDKGSKGNWDAPKKGGKGNFKDGSGKGGGGSKKRFL